MAAAASSVLNPLNLDGRGRGRSLFATRRRFDSLRGLSSAPDAAAVAELGAALPPKIGSWTWKHGLTDAAAKVHFVEHSSSAAAHGSPPADLLLLPTISDVSTTEEWEAVATSMVDSCSCRAVTVDWPGFGQSDRPPLDYTADLMEKFLVGFMTALDGPLQQRSSSDAAPPVIIAAGHAASVAAKALAGGSVKASAMVAVAPTWAGPLPIVFGRTSEAESRYGLLRSALRAPALGWAMYNVLVSSPGNIRKQYESHVYADASNVSDAVVSSRLALTKRPGARYAPAAFLTGRLDPCETRGSFVAMFEQLQKLSIPTLVMLPRSSPRRSKAEMEALREVVSKFVEIPGALLAQEEFPEVVSQELRSFLQQLRA